MNFIYHHYILVTVLVVLGFVIAAGSAMLEAWLDIHNRPKEEMFWCHKKGHGYFRKKHALKLFPDLPDDVQNSFVCPMCYYSAVFEEPDKKLRTS